MSYEIRRTVSMDAVEVERYAGACLMQYRETGEDYYMGAADALKLLIDNDVTGLNVFKSRLNMNLGAFEVAKKREAAEREAKANLIGGDGRG